MKRRWRAIANITIITAATLVLIWIATTRPFSDPYTVVNAGDGKVYKVNRRTGESWLLLGNREIPVGSSVASTEPTSPDELAKIELESAISDAQSSYVLRDALNVSGNGMDNETVIQELLERDHYAKIKGWSGQKIDEDTFLVSFEYEDRDGNEVGYYFEVNLAVDIVRNIFFGSGLYKRYEKYGLNPVYGIGNDGRTVVWSWKKDPVVGGETTTKSQ